MCDRYVYRRLSLTQHCFDVQFLILFAKSALALPFQTYDAVYYLPGLPDIHTVDVSKAWLLYLDHFPGFVRPVWPAEPEFLADEREWSTPVQCHPLEARCHLGKTRFRTRCRDRCGGSQGRLLCGASGMEATSSYRASCRNTWHFGTVACCRETCSVTRSCHACAKGLGYTRS